MTDAQRRFCEQVQNAQARAVAKALVNLYQIHRIIRNKPLHLRSIYRLFWLLAVRERGIESDYAAISNRDIRRLVSPPRSDIALQRSNRIRRQRPAPHSEARGLQAVEFSRNGLL